MIKTVLFLLFILAINISILAQTDCKYCQDVDSFVNVLRKTPSYKEQVRGEKEIAFKNLVAEVKSKISPSTTKKEVFSQISRLVSFVRDNHLYFYEVQPKDSSLMGEVPKIDLDFAELEKRLSQKEFSDIEGIYYFDNFIKVGLYRTEEKNLLQAVVLESKLTNWKIGEIAFQLEEIESNRFRSIHYTLNQKTLVFFQNEKYQIGRLSETAWQKKGVNYDFFNPLKDTQKFDFKVLNPNIQYLRLGSFATSTKNIDEINKFYDQIYDKINAPNLIVDLRNNGGGGFKASGKFLKLLKNLSKKSKIFLLINIYTVSNAEQFVVKMREEKNIKVLGEDSKGKISYGNNLGTSELLPSRDFKFYITDIRDDTNYLQYEDIGLKPDVYLKTDSDWLEQTIGFINKQN